MQRSMVAAALAIGLIFSGAPASAAKLVAVDEADDDLSAARAEIQRAVSARDLAALGGFLAEDVGCGFGGCVTREETIDALGFRDPDAAIWGDLEGVLASGGQYAEDGAFFAPYWFTAWPDDFDPFEFMLAPGTVPLRGEPEGDPVAELTDDIVKVVAYGPDVVQVEDSTTGAVGFVATADLVSPVGLRIRLEQTDAGWKIIDFISGD
jgi:hypothetical protein